jgi:hypothetical protein
MTSRHSPIHPLLETNTKNPKEKEEKSKPPKLEGTRFAELLTPIERRNQGTTLTRKVRKLNQKKRN